MAQRNSEFSSSSSFSKCRAVGFTLGSMGAKEPRKNSIEQREVNPVTSVSTKLHGIILKDKVKESNADERIDVTCSTSAPSQQSQHENKRSNGHQVLPKVQPTFPLKRLSCTLNPKQTGVKLLIMGLWARKPQEQYFEGCLVMGRIACGYPLWPGMIRKPDSANGHTKFIRGRIRFCVQFFEDPTALRWLTSSMLRGFDAAKTNRRRLRVATTPIVFLKFEKALRIAKAVANLSVGVRLAKYTLKENRKLKDSATEAQQKRFLKQRVENLELQGNLEKEGEDMRNCQENLEKMRSEVFNHFGVAPSK